MAKVGTVVIGRYCVVVVKFVESVVLRLMVYVWWWWGLGGGIVNEWQCEGRTWLLPTRSLHIPAADESHIALQSRCKPFPTRGAGGGRVGGLASSRRKETQTRTSKGGSCCFAPSSGKLRSLRVFHDDILSSSPFGWWKTIPHPGKPLKLSGTCAALLSSRRIGRRPPARWRNSKRDGTRHKTGHYGTQL